MARKKKNNTSPAAKDKAALYIRVSTVYQIDKDSLKVQERELINYTKLVLNMNEYEIFRDAGYSAKNTDRPDYQKMMQKLRTGEFSHLVVWKIDRISRNLMDFAEMYAELKDLGVTFVSKNEQFDTSSAIGEAMLKIILVFAELERQMTSERVTAVMISRAESGSWNGGKVPLGYIYDKETKSFGIHPEQAEVVKLIYDSYERMQSSTAVAKFLNEKGITTKAGNKWNPSTVCLILRNPVYKGTMVYNKRRISVTGKLKPEDEWVTVENHHAAIIDAEQFERCHALLKKNMIGSDRSTYFRGNCRVLAGLLYCDYCGSMMAAQIGKPLKSKGDIIPSNYSCYNKRHGLCENPFTSDSLLGPFILNYVANMYRIQRTFRKATSIETLEKKLLRGETFKEVDHIEANGLTQLYQALKNQIFADNPVFYEPNLPEHEAAPDQKAIYLGEKASHERALYRLHQLFMYADSGMSETEYFAELERHNAAERSKAVLLSKAEAGEYTGFRIPFGYRRDPQTKEYSVDEPEANIIRTIFNMFDQGITVYAIAKHLNSLPLAERIKKKWLVPAIERMLTNISYTGALRYNYRSYTSKKERVINDEKDLVLVENDHPAIISSELFEQCQQRYTDRKNTVYHVRKQFFAELLTCTTHQIPLSWEKENARKFSSPATYWCPHCPKSNFTDKEVGSFIMNYLLNLLRACGQISPSTSPLALKRMLLRGKDFDEIAALANAEEIKLSLLGSDSIDEDVPDKQRKLKFEIQMKERELERMESLEANNSDKADDRMDHLKEAVKKLSAELQHLENSIGTQSLPQVDYLKKAMTFSFSVTYTTSPVLISRIV